MRATIWGCRGSLATPGAPTVRYGGNTSCVEIRSAGGAVAVLDAGTGIVQLGRSLVGDRAVGELDLLLTHLHLDHVEGLGFFAPLFDPSCTVTIWGPRPGPLSLADQLAVYLSPPFFPVPFEEFPARIEVREIEGGEWTLGDLRGAADHVTHRGPTLGYRLEGGGRSLAYVPDNEPGVRADSGAALAAAADVLVHDAQYTAAEYATRRGWGHTALPDFARVVRTAAPGRAVMFHHDPAHDDEALESMLADVLALDPGVPVELAREGLELL